MYETIVKTLIQLDPGDWEGVIDRIKASLDTARAADVSTISVDMAEKLRGILRQNTDPMGETDTEEKTAITPTTRPMKHPETKSPTKIRSEDKISLIRPLASIDYSPNKKT